MKGLYVIVDPEHCQGRDPRWVCEEALAGGARMIQLRAKQLPDAAHLTLARQLRALCRDAGVPFWLNDRADIASLCQADGLHLGQDDVPIAEARTLVPNLALGLSTHSREQAQRSLGQGLCLIGFGPVFPTQSKLHADPTVGLSGLREACALVQGLDVVAIGGINATNASQLLGTGASYAAVISAVCGAKEPREATRGLADILAS